VENLCADLHIHSSFSDGTFSPQELVKKAQKLGLSCIAITDHDCVDAIEPALNSPLGDSVEVVPAVELSAEVDNIETHILGYFIDYKNEQFTEKLKLLCKAREERMHKMVEKLNALGIKINVEEVLEFSKTTAVGRPHIARLLVKKGFVKTISEAFRKYIGNQGPCYVKRMRLSPGEAIGMIKQNKGIAVLAHPYNMHNDNLIIDLVKDGLEGIEVYHPDHPARLITHYLEIAKLHSLLVTGGSDCHGLGNGKIALGSIKIPYELVEKLKERSNEA